jgi:hypothetical protein
MGNICSNDYTALLFYKMTGQHDRPIARVHGSPLATLTYISPQTTQSKSELK